MTRLLNKIRSSLLLTIIFRFTKRYNYLQVSKLLKTRVHMFKQTKKLLKIKSSLKLGID